MKYTRCRAALLGCAVLCALLVSVTLVGPTPARAVSRPRITKVSATPTYASHAVSPKRVKIKYKLSTKSKVSVYVCNSSGNTIKKIVTKKSQKAGTRTVYWNLTTSKGAKVSNGLYSIRIKATNSKGKSTPYPAKVSVRVDSAAPYAYITAVSPKAISSKTREVATVTYRTTDNNSSLKVHAYLDVLNSCGTVVRTIAAPLALPGSGRTLTWNGTSSSGAPVPAGRYLLRIRVKDLAGNQRMSSYTAIGVSNYGPGRIIDGTEYTDAVVRTDSTSGSTHVVWSNYASGALGIRYRRLDAYGNTTVARSIVASQALSSDHYRGLPDVGADPKGGAYIVWRGEGQSTSRRAIWLARIDADGKVAWSKPVLFESSSSYQYRDPRVSVGPNGFAHIVCWKGRAPHAIYYASYRPDGIPALGWSALISGDANGTARAYPNVDVDASGRVHVVWYDARDHGTDLSRREIYYARLAFAGGSVAGASGGTIAPRRLTTTTYGYDSEWEWSPEIDTSPDGTAQITWPDKKSASSSTGIMFARIAPNGTISVTPRSIFNGSSTSSYGRYGYFAKVAALSNGVARVVFQAREGISAPARLWQVDVGASGSVGTPILITAGAKEDLWPSVTAGPSGSSRLVYLADTGVLKGGSIVQRLTYCDTTVQSAACDKTRHDLEVDAAHWSFAGSPSPPRQNSTLTITVRVTNAGWVSSTGGTAVLEYKGTQVDSVPIPPLSREAGADLVMHWTIPNDATETPAVLKVRVIPASGKAQNSTTNDTANLKIDFLTPPTSVNLAVQVFDETHDESRLGLTYAQDPDVAIAGTTAGGQPYSADANEYLVWREFLNVPLGTYNITHSAPGYLVSPPSPQTVTIAADPGDPYKVTVDPGWVMDLWTNRWGAIDGEVRDADTNAAISAATVTIVDSPRSATSAAGTGAFDFDHLCEGDYTLKAVKSGYARTYKPQTILPATTHPATVQMEKMEAGSTVGYIVGTITDVAGYPAINDPDSYADDPTVKVKSGSSVVAQQTPHDGHFDITVPTGSYTLEFSAPGYVSVTGVSTTVQSGLEIDRTRELDLDVSELKHKASDEKWGVAWTMSANFGGSQPPKSPVPSYNIKQWWGLHRFWLDCDYQRVGLEDYIRQVQVKFTGEAYEHHYFYGVSPPEAPHTFFGDKWYPWSDDYYDLPELYPGMWWNRTAIRCDGVDIIDGRDWSTVSSIRSTWNSCLEPDGHRYGEVVSGQGGDGSFGAYTHAVPFDEQVIRLWITVGKTDPSTGEYINAGFDDISGMNYGGMMNATGYRHLQLYYRPSGGADDPETVWVEPALVGYPDL